MNGQLLLAWLRSEHSIDRIRAARSFAKEKHPECLQDLRIAYQNESVPWVRKAIQQALWQTEATTHEPQAIELPPEFELSIEAIQSQAINESIGQVLHELEPAVGRLRVVAREVVLDFDQSKLCTEFIKLEELLETFEKWRAVEQQPQPKDCNIGDLLTEIKVAASFSHSMQVHGMEEISITTDPQLLKIVLLNALRNAAEASELVTNANPIVMSFGKTDCGVWLSIVDFGIGLSTAEHSLSKANISTKPGHRGMGLAIIDRGIRALKGNWDLRNGTVAGAEFFLELPNSIL